MDFEEFNFSDDDFAKDNALTPMDNALVKILDRIIDSANEMKTNLQYNEHTDAVNNSQILVQNINMLLSVMSISDEDLSDEELEEALAAVERSTTELQLNNIDNLLGDPEESLNTINKDSNETDTTDNSLDF